MARGSIRLKREPDYWELMVLAGRDAITGRKRYVCRSFRGGKREANKSPAQLVAEIDSNGAQADQSLDGLLTAHIDYLEQRNREARTIEGYRSIARRVAADRPGNKRIQDLGSKDFDDFYVRLRSNGFSPSTIQRYRSLLGGSFQQAMKWGWAPRNVVRLATPAAAPRRSHSTPTHAVVAALLRTAASSRNPENHVAFRLLASTGTRRGEVCGLRWSSVDLERTTWRIRGGTRKRLEPAEYRQPGQPAHSQLTFGPGRLEPGMALMLAHQHDQGVPMQGAIFFSTKYGSTAEYAGLTQLPDLADAKRCPACTVEARGSHPLGPKDAVIHSRSMIVRGEDLP